MLTILKTFLIAGLLLISTTGLTQTAHTSAPDYPSLEQPTRVTGIIDSVISFGKNYIGKPYRFRTDGTMLDCSGFIGHIFNAYEIELPRTSAAISKETEKISLDEVEKGDLLFFKGRNTSSNAVGHVSLVVKADVESVQMMHSCNRGIIIDDYDAMNYYKKRLLHVGRLHPKKESLKLDHIAFDDTLKKASDSLQVKVIDIIPEVKIKDTLKIIGVGDLMLGTNFPSEKYLPANDGKDLLREVTPIIQSADLTFGNLEGVILSGEGDVKKCNDPSKCYAFKSPDHYVHHYKDAGFDVLSLANNHAGDFGNTGRENTMKLLDSVGIHHAGQKTHSFTIFEKDSLTYGFCAFSPNYGTVRITDYDKATEIVQHLDSLCDIVIVSFHGGAEGAKYNRVTRKTEMFLGENRGNPYEFSRIVIDAGADVVFGHGPHVVRAADLYKDRFIIYSMGNFATYGRFNLRGLNGLAPIIELNVTKDGTFIDGKIHSAKQTGEGGPKLDPMNAAAKEIKRLTELDIPEAVLEIADDGRMTVKKKD